MNRMKWIIGGAVCVFVLALVFGVAAGVMLSGRQANAPEKNITQDKDAKASKEKAANAEDSGDAKIAEQKGDKVGTDAANSQDTDDKSNKIFVGDSEEKVVGLLGEPDRISSQDNRLFSSVTYHYEFWDNVNKKSMSITVMFQNDKVAGWKEHSSRRNQNPDYLTPPDTSGLTKDKFDDAKKRIEQAKNR